MKKLFVSVGLAATAAGLSSAFAQGMQAASPKLWNVSSTLRGFYDDNYTYGNSKTGSWGWEFSPSISGNVDLKQTDFGARYTFGMYYYVQRAEDGVAPLDYTHQGDLWLDHSFNQTLKLNTSDTLVVAQDPKLVNGGTVDRVNGNNLNNTANLALTKEWTRHFNTATHYQNQLVIYSESTGTNNQASLGGSPGTDPSNAALLNRMLQSVGNDFQWEFSPETMGFVGYQFSFMRYTGNQKIATDNPVNGHLYKYYSDSRDYNAHYGYVGGSHVFSPNISASGKLGASYVDSYNNPTGDAKSWAPYADLSATYTYIPGSYVQLGVQQDINSTSEASVSTSNGQITLYQKTTTSYLSWTHRFDPKISSTVIGQYSYSSFKNGPDNGQPENTLDVGVNLNYQINRHFWAEAGYNFDELFSNVDNRGNTRNRVYVGLGASY